MDVGQAMLFRAAHADLRETRQLTALVHLAFEGFRAGKKTA
jgi:hypothetical protein